MSASMAEEIDLALGSFSIREDRVTLAVHVSEQLTANGYGKLEGLVVEDASIEDADAYPDGTVIVDNQGEAWQKSGGMWYLAVGGYMDTGPADYLPVTVLRVGRRPE